MDPEAPVAVRSGTGSFAGKPIPVPQPRAITLLLSLRYPMRVEVSDPSSRLIPDHGK